jgi:hypothetical protein
MSRVVIFPSSGSATKIRLFAVSNAILPMGEAHRQSKFELLAGWARKSAWWAIGSK